MLVKLLSFMEVSYELWQITTKLHFTSYHDAYFIFNLFFYCAQPTFYNYFNHCYDSLCFRFSLYHQKRRGSQKVPFKKIIYLIKRVDYFFILLLLFASHHFFLSFNHFFNHLSTNRSSLSSS